MKRFAVLLAAGLIVSGGGVFLYLRAERLSSQTRQLEQMFENVNGEVARLRSEKEMIEKTNEKLEADTVAALSLNKKFANEKEELQASLVTLEKSVKAKEDMINNLTNKLKEIEKGLLVKKNRDRPLPDGKEKKETSEKVRSLEENMARQKALYSYNLGVAYTKAKLYDEAIQSYIESLQVNMKNPEAHYNLALLYENISHDPAKAAFYYKRYLEYDPDAEDKEDVEALIKKLMAQVFWSGSEIK
jgi:tetratricopeptide (TPR) repeat protein